MNAYEQGRQDMREQLVAFLYTQYIHYRTFHGRESEQAMILKNIIQEIRHDQENEQSE
jgi:uncharacterized membrane protein YgaE (UPF0421/DUF939 family)